MKKHFKLLVSFGTILLALVIMATATVMTTVAAEETDFTGYEAISSADDLLKLMNSTEAVTGKYYLADDIDLTGKAQSPIGKPDGKSFGLANEDTSIFNGNGKTVKGVNISGKEYTGFFGVVENAEIRNLTIEGEISVSGGDYNAGLVAYAKTSAVIEKCVNKCKVTSSDRINVGGILGGTEASSMAYLKISGCTNEGEIKAARTLGGIVGVISSSIDNEIIIEKCINNGKVTATSTSAASKLGGILGTYTGTKGSFTIKKCMNAADVTGYYYMGGIIGELTGTDSSSTYVYDSAKFHVTECWNDGTVTSTRTSSNQASQIGGIIGVISKVGDVRDCLNTGTISAKLRRLGGLFGQISSSNDFFGAKNNLNRGTVLLNDVAETNDDNVNSIGGYLAYKPYGINYYTGTLQGKVWENTYSGASSTQYNSTLFDDLNESGNWVNPAEPVLDVFKEQYCAKYGHASTSFSAGDDSCVIFTCAICETEFYQDATVETTVYVDETNGILAVDVSEDKNIGTSDAPFKSLTEAFEYVAIAAALKDTDVTINISGTAVLEDSYRTPDIDKTITVTGGTFRYGGTTAANRRLFLGGPMVFENITFTSAGTEARIYAQNNKLVMGEGIVMKNATTTTKVNSSVPFEVNDVKMIVLGGFYETIPEKMATDITIRSGEYYIVSGWNYTNETTATEGTAKITVGKTNADDTLKICDLVAFCTAAQTRLTGDSTATMIIDGDADIARLIISERETTTNEVAANYTTHLVLRGNVSESYRSTYMAPYGVDITGGAHGSASLGYHTFRIFTDKRVEGAVLLEHAFFGGDGYTADTTLTTGGYKPVSDGGDVTMTQHTYMEYCVTYLDGHNDVDTLCDECGADTTCTHANAETIVVAEPTCSREGSQYKFCADCGTSTPEEILPIDPDAHNYVWETFDGGYRYVCTNNPEHVYCTYNKAITEFYVSDNGKADGGFSASYPSNDFDSIMKLAAASDNDATVYILGSITLVDNDDTDYEVYIEPVHTNTITVRGYENTSGIIQIGSRDTRLEYVLSGDTTFEQIEFNTGISTNSFYITARHNHLVMGDRITSSFARYNGDSQKNSGKLVVIGGCDNTIDSSACTKTDTHITLKSGTYYMVMGGSSLKGCGLVDGTINIEVLGDITVGGVVTNKKGYIDRQFILGCHSADAGDINMVIDGNITCTNAFCIGSYGTKTVNKDDIVCRTVGDVSIIIKSGSLTDYSFSGRSDYAIIYEYGSEFAETYNPSVDQLDTATLVIFPLGNSHSHAIRGGVMKSVDNLYIIYDATTYSTVELAERFRLSLGGSDNFHMDVLPKKPCTSLSGRHTASGEGIVVLEATCRGEGSIEYTCLTCGETYTESTPRLAHEYGEATLFSDANCISPAIYIRICQNDNCGYKIYSTSGEATGIHVYDENNICSSCGLSKQEICAHENLSEAVEFVSGCGVGTKQYCLDCDKEFITIDSADHKFGAYTVTVQPTATKPGIKTRTCKSCGKVETAIIYADGSAVSSSAIATDASGNLANLDVVTNNLTSAEKTVLNALLQDTSYGSEVKVSYEVGGDTITNITYRIPLPAEYADMQNVNVVVKDDDGTLHYVDFKIDKGYIVFTF